jgi:hypothetical protein
MKFNKWHFLNPNHSISEAKTPSFGQKEIKVGRSNLVFYNDK